ncbi:VanZ family protein [Natrinema amylolyticum]|uniref:VanZ family protein n=1 Tax=Natrinema amylolyticum TaxID=2878679 RepID=UPI001CFA7FCA
MVTEAGVIRAAVISDPGFAWLDIRHGIAYGGLALSLKYALRDHEMAIVQTALLVFCITVGYGAVMEIDQVFRPDRIATLADAASNAVGAGVALALSGFRRQSSSLPASSSDEF